LSDKDSVNRCYFRDRAGRRCRLPRQQGHPTFCARHARPAQPEAGFGAPGKGPVPVGNVDLSAELLGPINDFRTATSINYTLGRLLIYKAAGEISSKDTAVIAYVCQLLLQTIPLVRRELRLSRYNDEEGNRLNSVVKATSTIWDEDEDSAENKGPKKIA